MGYALVLSAYAKLIFRLRLNLFGTDKVSLDPVNLNRWDQETRANFGEEREETVGKYVV